MIDAGAPAALTPENAALAAELGATLGTLHQAAADDAAAQAPPGAAGGAPGAPPVNSWRPFIIPTVTIGAMVVLPQWQLTPEEQHEIADSLSECLEQLFPGGLDGRYACYVRLLMCTGAIILTRYQAGGGKLPGLGPRRAAVEAPQAAPAGG